MGALLASGPALPEVVQARPLLSLPPEAGSRLLGSTLLVPSVVRCRQRPDAPSHCEPRGPGGHRAPAAGRRWDGGQQGGTCMHAAWAPHLGGAGGCRQGQQSMHACAHSGWELVREFLTHAFCESEKL